jgi:hypothetical protein
MMQSILLNSRVGPDGVLKLDVPIGLHDADLEVMVVFQLVTPSQKSSSDASAWPVGFFEKTFGCLRDEFIMRESQGEYEVRDEFQ